MSITTAIFRSDYILKTINFAKNSNCHKTTAAHFLNHGKWNDHEKTIKQIVVDIIYQEAIHSGKPIFCIVNDMVASHTKPSSQALHPMEAAYFHQSHLKKKQDYGHRAIAVMLFCNEITLNYAIILYDSWYPSSKIMEWFIRKEFHTISAFYVLYM